MHNRYVMNLLSLIIIVLLISPVAGSAIAQTPEPPLPVEMKGRLVGYPAHPPVAGPAASAPDAFTPDPILEVDAWSKLAFQSYRTGNWDIYFVNPNGKNPFNVTNHPASDARARLNAGATHIVFNTDRDGNYEIYSAKTDGTELKRLTFRDGSDYMPDWSPDGDQIVFVSTADKSDEIFRMNADG